MAWNTSLKDLLTRKLKVSGLTIHSVADSKRRGINTSERQREISINLENIPFPSYESGKTTNINYKLKYLDMVDEHGQLLRNDVTQILKGISHSPLMATENRILLEKLHKITERKTAELFKNAMPFKPGEVVKNTLQTAAQRGYLGDTKYLEIEHGYIPVATSLSMQLPKNIYNREFKPGTGDVPTGQPIHRQYVKMTNRRGVTVGRIIGNEVTENVYFNDPDGDRLLMYLWRTLNRKKQVTNEFSFMHEFPTVAELGPILKPEKSWSMTNELALFGPLNLSKFSNLESLGKKLTKQSTPAVTADQLRKSLMAAFANDGQTIGTKHRQIEVNTLIAQHLELQSMPAAARSELLDDPASLISFLAETQPMKQNGGIGGARKQLEMAVQAVKKGRSFSVVMQQLTSGLARQALLIIHNKELLNASQGELLRAYKGMRGNVRESLLHARFGFTGAENIEENYYKGKTYRETLRIKNFEIAKPKTGAKSMLTVLKQKGMLDIQGMGNAELLRINDPLSGKPMSIGQEIIDESLTDKLGSGYLMPRIRVRGVKDSLAFSTYLESELESNERVRGALTIFDKSIGKSRLIGELKGPWDTEQLKMGGTFQLQHVKKLALATGIDEDEIMLAAKTNPQKFSQLVFGYELTLDSYRLNALKRAIFEVVNDLDGTSVRYKIKNNQLIVNEALIDASNNLELIDTGIVSGESDERAEATLKMIDKDFGYRYGAKFKITSNPRILVGYKASAGNPRVFENLRQARQATKIKDVKAGIIQLHDDKYIQHLIEEGEIGLKQAQAVVSNLTGNPEVSVKAVELLGQESSFASSSLIDRIIATEKKAGVHSASETKGAAIGKIMGAMGEIKDQLVFGEGEFIAKLTKKFKNLPKGTELPQEFLTPLERGAVRGTLNEQFEAVEKELGIPAPSFGSDETKNIANLGKYTKKLPEVELIYRLPHKDVSLGIGNMAFYTTDIYHSRSSTEATSTIADKWRGLIEEAEPVANREFYDPSVNMDAVQGMKNMLDNAYPGQNEMSSILIDEVVRSMTSRGNPNTKLLGQVENWQELGKDIGIDIPGLVDRSAPSTAVAAANTENVANTVFGVAENLGEALTRHARNILSQLTR